MVKRWSSGIYYAGPEEVDDGPWVKYPDYASLEAEHRKLKEAVREYVAALSAVCPRDPAGISEWSHRGEAAIEGLRVLVNGEAAVQDNPNETPPRKP